jgi:ubiquinol-cytochrome c reductase cytochrome b subunit
LFLFLVKSHLHSYPCPVQINYLWNLGFLLAIAIVLQIVTGIFLALFYSSDITAAYLSLFYLIRELVNGSVLRFLHSGGASFVFLLAFLHLGRGLFYGSYAVILLSWVSGVILFLILMAIAFLGYVLPLGQMSFWGATVITNLLSPFPNVVEMICGGYGVHNPTLHRFFIFHFLLPFIALVLLVIHLFYLHFQSSNNPMTLTTNNKVPFYPFIYHKDALGRMPGCYRVMMERILLVPMRLRNRERRCE